MEQQLPIALQVAVYAASGAIVLIAAVVVHVWLRVGKQLDRVVTAVEHVEAELIPLARETRVVVERMREFSERTVGVAGDLLLPFQAFNRTVGLLQTGVATFLKTLWSGRRRQPDASDGAGRDNLS